jgi:arsenate reductase (glutaredoxin)
MSDVTIWHNPSCGSSKGAMDYLASKGITPTVYLYAKAKPSKKDVQAVLKLLKLKPKELLRPGEKKGEALGVYEASVTDAQVLDAMVAEPILIQRPIVITAKGAVIARPKGKIDDIL